MSFKIGDLIEIRGETGVFRIVGFKQPKYSKGQRIHTEFGVAPIYSRSVSPSDLKSVRYGLYADVKERISLWTYCDEQNVRLAGPLKNNSPFTPLILAKNSSGSIHAFIPENCNQTKIP